MADFTSVPTVELLTRAADAAGRAAADAMCVRRNNWADMPARLRGVVDGRRLRLIAASGPDHWRAVETTFRRALERTEQVAATVGCTIEQAAATSVILPFLRPLAEQVLQHLGDTE